MIRPNFEQFCTLRTRGNLIPLVRELLADMDTPLSVFRRLDDGKTSFLLESVEGGEKWARYSFIGTGARAVFRSRGSEVEWVEFGETRRFSVSGDPLQLLRERMARATPVEIEGIELPRFVGGAVGMVSWDWVRFIEKIPDQNPDELGAPEVYFVIPETVVVYDNVRHMVSIVRMVEMDATCRDEADLAALYRSEVEALDAVVHRLRAPLAPEPDSTPIGDGLAVRANTTREGYYEIVRKAKEYIRAGDIFQVVPSQRFTVPLRVDPFLIYRQLRLINPSPYLFYFRCEGNLLVGSSPEILVRLEDGKIDVRPIAGTRKRGKTEAEDLALEADLLADPKERAEHLMLVDLGRNDIGRVAETGSVRVSEYAIVERYSHVMHLVSNVQGRLRTGLDWLDVLRATFPAGTLSGAPKVRAMEIIDELETVRRGPYGGCIGYIDYFGNMDMAITIRTMFIHDREIVVQSGGGVVADSDPEAEFQETVNKAKALMRAIELAQKGNG